MSFLPALKLQNLQRTNSQGNVQGALAKDRAKATPRKIPKRKRRARARKKRMKMMKMVMKMMWIPLQMAVTQMMTEMMWVVVVRIR